MLPLTIEYIKIRQRISKNKRITADLNNYYKKILDNEGRLQNKYKKQTFCRKIPKIL